MCTSRRTPKRSPAAPRDSLTYTRDVTTRVTYDEFGLFHENAAEYGLAFDGPPTVRREFVEVAPGRKLSALVWGTAAPEIVFLHGGAQNAHTWDTVIMAIGRPALAIDLPGHGHSDAVGAPQPGDAALAGNARDIAVVVKQLAPRAKLVVGMSLGGLTTLAFTRDFPELVRRVALIDVTPGVNREKSKAITAFVNGPKTFPSFEELLARTIEHNPTRTEASLRRGILHNALQHEDGSWVWRYRRFDGEMTTGLQPSERDDVGGNGLWDVVSGTKVPLMLVRGLMKQSVVDDADEDELFRRKPDARIVHIANAGHSIQGDTPRELAIILDEFAK
jgi:pimeloyl-ACP methyl ester carboxylesterase